MKKLVQSSSLIQNFIYRFMILCFFSIYTADLTGAILNVPSVYPTIQAGINAAANGDTVEVAAGTYNETPIINGKSITLSGASAASTIILAPNVTLTNSFTYTFTGVTYYPVLTAINAPTINIQNLTVNGNDQGGNSAGFFVGIGYHNAGGTIQGVNVINATFSAAPGNQTGNGIEVANDTGANTINILNSTLSVIQKTFIGVRGMGLTINISGNTMVGRSGLPSGGAAENGITIQDNATGMILNNTISQMQCPVVGTDSTGILPFNGGPNLVIENNNVTACDLAIAAVDTGNNLLIQGNTCNDNVTHSATGITIQDPAGITTLIGNLVENNAGMGILLESASVIRVSPDAPAPTVFILIPNPLFFMANNIIIGGPIGMEVEGSVTAGPVVSMNSDSFAGQTEDFIIMNACPNDIWPTTDTVSFDGLISGVNMTFAEFLQTLTKIIDKHNNPALGLVLDFIPLPTPFSPSDFIGVLKKNKFLNETDYRLVATWDPSPSADVVAYRIFKNGKGYKDILASSPRVFHAYIRSKHAADEFAIAAVSSNDLLSPLVPITIVSK